MKLADKLFLSLGIIVLGAGIIGSAIAQDREQSLSGEVNRIWEDGFQLQEGDRAVSVDSWSVCGDETPQHLALGDRVTVVGEFDGGEFDAFSIAKADGTNVCRQRL